MHSGRRIEKMKVEEELLYEEQKEEQMRRTCYTLCRGVRRGRRRRRRRGRCKIGKIFIVRLSAQNINGSFSMDSVCFTFSWITLPRGGLNVRLRVLAFENSDEWHSGLLNAHAANMVFKLSVWLNPDKVGSAWLATQVKMISLPETPTCKGFCLHGDKMFFNRCKSIENNKSRLYFGTKFIGQAKNGWEGIFSRLKEPPYVPQPILASRYCGPI